MRYYKDRIDIQLHRQRDKVKDNRQIDGILQTNRPTNSQTNRQNDKVAIFFFYKSRNLLFKMKVAMQANVPQPTHDEDETDDVDEELKKLQVKLPGISRDQTMADILMYIPNDDTQLAILQISINGRNVLTLDYMNKPIKIHYESTMITH